LLHLPLKIAHARAVDTLGLGRAKLNDYSSITNWAFESKRQGVHIWHATDGCAIEANRKVIKEAVN